MRDMVSSTRNGGRPEASGSRGSPCAADAPNRARGGIRLGDELRVWLPSVSAGTRRERERAVRQWLLPHLLEIDLHFRCWRFCNLTLSNWALAPRHSGFRALEHRQREVE